MWKIYWVAVYLIIIIECSVCRDYLPINPSGDAFQFEVDAWTNYKFMIFYNGFEKFSLQIYIS